MKLKDLLEVIAPLPWKLDGTAITDGGPNIIAACSKGWSDDKANTAYLHHAANVLPQLVEAGRRQCDDIAHPGLIEALRIADEVKMPNADLRRSAGNAAPQPKETTDEK